MKIKCSWCGSWINDYDEVCPNFGGKNDNFKRVGTGVPQTIEELKAWAVKHNVPLRQMQTYIGENYTGAKAFGIYKDEITGNYIVYKNKADGTRAVRYEGPDEAYAVNELYQKMKERMAEQKRHQSAAGRNINRSNGPVYLNTGNPVGYENKPYRQKPERSIGRIVKYLIFGFLGVQLLAVLLPIIIFLIIRVVDKSPYSGYYNYNGSMYYWQDTTDAWYIYNYDADRWDICYDDLENLYDNYDDYHIPSYSYDDYNVTDFTQSGYYVEPSYSDDSDWDSDYDYDDDWDSDWDSDYDWDSGWDDWDSDW